MATDAILWLSSEQRISMKSCVLAASVALLLLPAAVGARAGEEHSVLPNALGGVTRPKSPVAPTTGNPRSGAVASPLDRVAHAVDGAESSFGADLAMWRPDPAGPQGPMQVTEAAATDVGGGDRFDTVQNRAIGRAYLAQLYWRYKNWPDAIAAYNWGVGNLDTWVKAGRPPDRFVNGVAVYLRRVLHDSGLCDGSAAAPVRRVSLKKPLSSWLQQQQTDAGAEAQSDTFEQAVCRNLDNWVGAPDGTDRHLFGFVPNRFYSKLESAMGLVQAHLQPSKLALQRP
jgi:hypothetical protein